MQQRKVCVRRTPFRAQAVAWHPRRRSLKSSAHLTSVPPAGHRQARNSRDTLRKTNSVQHRTSLTTIITNTTSSIYGLNRPSEPRRVLSQTTAPRDCGSRNGSLLQHLTRLSLRIYAIRGRGEGVGHCQKANARSILLERLIQIQVGLFLERQSCDQLSRSERLADLLTIQTAFLHSRLKQADRFNGIRAFRQSKDPWNID
jgi:hypothetical protein